MKQLTWAGYSAALKAARRIENPTQDQILAVCPHLTKEQVVNFMDEGGGYIALPPLRIKCGFRIAKYYPGDQERGYEPTFSVTLGCGRTPRSYADGENRDDMSLEYRFAAESIAYAERHWPDKLIIDDWADFQIVYVQDPTDQTEDGGPKTTAVIYVCLGRDWNKLVNDHTKPQWVAWNDAIVRATLDPLEADELQGGRGNFTEYNCAHCGGGLWLSSCIHCGKTFTGSQGRSGWATPLAPQLVKLLRDNGHVFAVDPDRLFRAKV